MSLFHSFSSALFFFQQTQDASFLKNLSNILLICRTAGTKPLQQNKGMLESSSYLELVIGCLTHEQKERGSVATNACLDNRELFPSNFSPQQLRQKKETRVFQGDDRHPLAPAKAPRPLALRVLCLRCLSTLITEPAPPRGSAAR